MSTLLVGFDSAWSATNRGAIVASLWTKHGGFRSLGHPKPVDHAQAVATILRWQECHTPSSTLVLLDQPTIVQNPTGQRPVENIVGSLVSRRRSGMQPANTGKETMFGRNAPVWGFLERFGGQSDPLKPASMRNQVWETYPALVLIAMNWVLPDSRPAGRLPKYNPAHPSKFSSKDWKYVCTQLSAEFRSRGLNELEEWLDAAKCYSSPHKSDQDGVDACLCLLVAIYNFEGKKCLMVGDLASGYIIVPDNPDMHRELTRRCAVKKLDASVYLRSLPEQSCFH